MREEWSVLYTKLVERCQRRVNTWGIGLDYASNSQPSPLENSCFSALGKKQIRNKL